MELVQLKSAAEDQMEMMMLPNFYGAFNDVVHSATSEFAANADSSAVPHFLDNSNVSASSFLNVPTNGNNTSFTRATPLQEHPSRWNGSAAEELSAADATLKKNSMAAMREMIFRIAAMQPIHIDPESVKPPKRRNVKISKDPQSVAARHRRERISERIRILQRLVPGGTKMDTASMLDEAIHYVKFLKTHVQSLQRAAANLPAATGVGFPVAMCSNGSFLPVGKGYQLPAQKVQQFQGEGN